MVQGGFHKTSSGKLLAKAGRSNPSRFQGRGDLKDITFSDGGPKAWFVVIKKS